MALVPSIDKIHTLKAFFETHRMEMTLFQSAERCLKSVLNGRDTIPNKAWK